jgi:hypothetical protein
MSKWSFDLYIENTQGNEIFGNGDMYPFIFSPESKLRSCGWLEGEIRSGPGQLGFTFQC